MRSPILLKQKMESDLRGGAPQRPIAQRFPTRTPIYTARRKKPRIALKSLPNRCYFRFLKMSVTTQMDSTNAPRYPKKDSTGTPRTRGSIVDRATMDEPMNKPATMIPSDSLLMMIERLRMGASEPRTSMFTLTCPRVSICSA